MVPKNLVEFFKRFVPDAAAGDDTVTKFMGDKNEKSQEGVEADLDIQYVTLMTHRRGIDDSPPSLFNGQRSREREDTLMEWCLPTLPLEGGVSEVPPHQCVLSRGR